jgi:hypothetical protein
VIWLWFKIVDFGVEPGAHLVRMNQIIPLYRSWIAYCKRHIINDGVDRFPDADNRSVYTQNLDVVHILEDSETISSIEIFVLLLRR